VKLLKDCCHREYTEYKNSNTWSVFEEVLQGMRARIFPKELEDFSIKLRRDRIFEAVEENLGRFSTLKHSKGRCCKVVEKISSSEGISCLLRKSH
jgi:hypothetical protein